MLCQHAKGSGTVKIIGSDCGKRASDGICGHQDGLTGAPWFLAIRRNRKSRRQLVEFLKHIFDGQSLFESRTNGFAKGTLDVAADDENELLEAGAHRIE